MSRCFADTAYYIALLSPDDIAHREAHEQAGLDRTVVTTSAVLNELGNHLSHPQNRATFTEFVEQMRRTVRFRLVHVDERLFEPGMTLYRERADKHWSLTDCISFVVMTQMQLSEALTTDHHFQQAGFTVLLHSS